MFIRDKDGKEFVDVSIITRLSKTRNQSGTFNVRIHFSGVNDPQVTLLTSVSEEEADALICRIGELKHGKCEDGSVIFVP